MEQDNKHAYVERRASGDDRAKTHDARRSSVFSLWLSWRELNGRRIIFSINVVLISLFIALPVSLDLVGNVRKSSVETKVDYMGPSRIIVPKGILSSDIVTARFKGKTFASSSFRAVEKDLYEYLRKSEARLTVRMILEGRDMAVTGIDFRNAYSYPFSQYSIRGDEVLLGKVAADKLNKDRGDSVEIRSQTFIVAGIIPTTGGIEDVSLFLSLPILQRLANADGRLNEIRLFPGSGSAHEQIKMSLEKYSEELNVIDAYRGDVAEKDIDSTLVNYQHALYTAAFILIALCIMISTYINLEGRKAEVSTIYTLGAAQGTVLQVLVLRTIWITLTGAVIGQAIAFFVAALQDLQVPLRFIWSGSTFIEVTLGTVFLGVTVTVPFALYSVYKRDLLAHL